MEPVRRAYGVLAERYIELFGHVEQVHADDLELIARRLVIRPGKQADVSDRWRVAEEPCGEREDVVEIEVLDAPVVRGR